MSEVSWFNAFREHGGPTSYGENRSASTYDIIQLIIILSFSTIFLAFLAIIPSLRHGYLRLLVKVTTSLFIGTVIIISLFSSSWQSASTQIQCTTNIFTNQIYQMYISVYVGLNSINITLTSPTETSIYYNEKFNWIKLEDFPLEHFNAKVKGLPTPILHVAEYFAVDYDEFLWRRKLRNAGYFTYKLMLLSMVIWLLTNIVFNIVICTGGYFLIATGVTMLLAVAMYTIFQPTTPLIIKIEGNALLFSFSWCYWLTLSTAIICIILGTTTILLLVYFPMSLSVEKICQSIHWMGYRLNEYQIELMEEKERSSLSPPKKTDEASNRMGCNARSLPSSAFNQMELKRQRGEDVERGSSCYSTSKTYFSTSFKN